jgi:hypothetical protein
MKIVKSLKQYLTKMGDINQRQTSCLTPCIKFYSLFLNKTLELYLNIIGKHCI